MSSNHVDNALHELHRMATPVDFDVPYVDAPLHLAKPPLYRTRGYLGELSPKAVHSISKTHALHLWEQATYGFLATNELVDEGYTLRSWADEVAPFMSKYFLGFRKNLDQAFFLVLLYMLSYTKGLKRTLTKDSLLVSGGEYEIGIRNSLVVGKYADGVPVDANFLVLRNPLPGHIRVANPMLRFFYQATVAGQKTEAKRERAALLLAFALFYASETYVLDKSMLRLRAFKDAVGVIRRGSRYPSSFEFETFLLGVDGPDITKQAWTYLRGYGMKARLFRKYLGNSSFLTVRVDEKRYEMANGYRDLLQGQGQC